MGCREDDSKAPKVFRTVRSRTSVEKKYSYLVADAKKYFQEEQVGGLLTRWKHLNEEQMGDKRQLPFHLHHSCEAGQLGVQLQPCSPEI